MRPRPHKKPCVQHTGGRCAWSSTAHTKSALLSGGKLQSPEESKCSCTAEQPCATAAKTTKGAMACMAFLQRLPLRAKHIYLSAGMMPMLRIRPVSCRAASSCRLAADALHARTVNCAASARRAKPALSTRSCSAGARVLSISWMRRRNTL